MKKTAIIFVLITSFGFLILDISLKYLNAGTIFDKYSSDHQNLTPNILTVDSILTGATFTFIIISFTMSSSKEEKLRNKVYWTSMPLWNKNGSVAYSTRSESFWGFVSLSFLSPMIIILLSTACTAFESIAMVLKLSVSAMVCECFTLWLLLAAVTRNKLFNDNVSYKYRTFIELFDNKKYALEISDQIDEVIESVTGADNGALKKPGSKKHIKKDDLPRFILKLLEDFDKMPSNNNFRNSLLELKDIMNGNNKKINDKQKDKKVSHTADKINNSQMGVATERRKNDN